MIKTKFISEATIQKVTKAVKSVGNWFLVAITALSAFFLGYYYPKIRKSHLMLIHLRYHAHILLKKKVINDFIHSEERQRVLH
jgi:succinate dehydrogenase hydrophobic anchor subunit